MQEIHVCSRRQAMDFTPHRRENSICISIGSSGQADGRLVAALKRNFATVLRLSFDDVETSAVLMRTFGPMDAQAIFEVVRDLPDDAPIMVHCEGGASRSVAIGYFLSALLRRGVKLHAARNFSMGNRLVLGVLRHTYLKSHLRQMKIPRFDIVRLRFPR